MINQKQKMFVECYLKNGYNACQAYYEVYGNVNTKKPSYPYILLKNPDVLEYLEQRRNEIYEGMNIDSIRVASELADIAFAPKGDEVYNTTAKLKALELLSKNLGLQTQKTETKGVIEVALEE